MVFDTNTYDFQLVSEVLSLKPIVVTAQRRDENLQDVPVSISVLDNRDMKSRGIESCF